jgi:hypothetical protein
MFLETFKKPIKYLTLTGIWIDKNTSRPRIALALLTRFIFIDIYVIFVTVHVCSLKTSAEFYKSTEVVSWTFALVIKTITITYNKNRIENLLQESKLMEEGSWIVKANGKKLQRRIGIISKIFKHSIRFLCAFNFIMSVATIVSQELPSVIWLPYDYSNSRPLFWMTLLIEVAGANLFIPVVIICDYFPNFFICFATGIKE